jgi:hypothetical protein
MADGDQPGGDEVTGSTRGRFSRALASGNSRRAWLHPREPPDTPQDRKTAVAWTPGGRSWRSATNAPVRRASGRGLSSAGIPRRVVPLRGRSGVGQRGADTRRGRGTRPRLPAGCQGVGHEERVPATGRHAGSRGRRSATRCPSPSSVPRLSQAALSVDLRSPVDRRPFASAGDPSANARQGLESCRTERLLPF